MTHPKPPFLFQRKTRELVLEKIRNILVIFLLSACVCAAQEATLIDKPGTYKFFDDRLLVDVTVENGRIQYTVGNGRFAGGITAEEAFPADSTWFPWPTTPKQVWAFYGKGPLHLITVTVGSSYVRFDDSSANPNLLNEAPENVLKAFEQRTQK